jgi:hypothetical protein
MSTTGPREMPGLEIRGLEIREHSAFKVRSSGRAVNGCRNLGQIFKE